MSTELIFTIMGVGLVCLTVGAAFTWGWPIALVVLGAMLIAGGWFVLVSV